MATRFWEDSDIAEVFKQTAKELKIEESVVREVISNMFLQVKKNISYGQVNKILLHNWGAWTISRKKLNCMIRDNIDKYRKGIITRDNLKKELITLFNLRHESKNKR